MAQCQHELEEASKQLANHRQQATQQPPAQQVLQHTALHALQHLQTFVREKGIVIPNEMLDQVCKTMPALPEQPQVPQVQADGKQASTPEQQAQGQGDNHPNTATPPDERKKQEQGGEAAASSASMEVDAGPTPADVEAWLQRQPQEPTETEGPLRETYKVQREEWLATMPGPKRSKSG